MAVEILQDVSLHLQFGWADKENFDALELRQQVGQRANSTAAIKFADEGHAQAVERPFPIDGVKIKQGLRGMLAPIAVTGIDNGHRRDLRRARCSSSFVMPDDDNVAVTAYDADGVFHLF